MLACVACLGAVSWKCVVMLLVMGEFVVVTVRCWLLLMMMVVGVVVVVVVVVVVNKCH